LADVGTPEVEHAMAVRQLLRRTTSSPRRSKSDFNPVSDFLRGVDA
jgi:hypothetical protein